MADPDWDSLTQETVRNLSRLLQAQTANPPGNEEPAVEVIRQILEANGFPSRDLAIVESAPHRVNLVARLPGDGSLRPLLLSGHTDVVPVERERWARDPFGGEVVDGEIWGRGALDMKGSLAMYLEVFLMALRSKARFRRDLILAAVADEEAGFTHGSKFLTDHHRELIEAEYGITEAGAITVYVGKARLYPIQVAERGICWLRMTASGKPGHGSMPHPDNAILHLAEAIEKIRRVRHLPVHLTSTFLKMMEAASRQVAFPLSLVPSLLRSPGLAGFLLNRLPEESRGLLSAMVANTVTPTILKAGVDTNVIPSVAEALLDCHKLPGQTSQDVMREIGAITGNSVTLEVVRESPGTEFPVDSPFYRTLEAAARRMDPQGIFVPMLMPAATDASHYQRAGVSVYGFTPGVLPPEFPTFQIGHGHNERLPVSSIRSGLPALWEVLTNTCA
ncbi:MAG TPA: M20/M25/M40 family metallo-hydrolase [Spirochaetia bacterium]|nr:M20/M25/M40 family metallo-hydrolase [Spirochaetia bacterium]